MGNNARECQVREGRPHSLIKPFTGRDDKGGEMIERINRVLGFLDQREIIESETIAFVADLVDDTASLKRL